MNKCENILEKRLEMLLEQRVKILKDIKGRSVISSSLIINEGENLKKLEEKISDVELILYQLDREKMVKTINNKFKVYIK